MCFAVEDTSENHSMESRNQHDRQARNEYKQNDHKNVGVLFILAAVTSIIGLAPYEPILNDPDYVIKGSANETQIVWGVVCELALAFSVIGISTMVLPILKGDNESPALGYGCFDYSKHKALWHYLGKRMCLRGVEYQQYQK
jgi:hypothetical protein